MSGDKCNLCGMKVLNMEVHMKLNHKKRKSTKTEGFRFTGYGATTAAPPSSLPSITKYQKTQNTTTDKGGSKNIVKSGPDQEFESYKSGMSYNEVSHTTKNNQCLQKSLVMLGNLMDQETARTTYKLEDVTDSDMKDIFKSGSITKESFELKLKLLGMIRIGNTYKKKDDRYFKYCPDCGVAFHWDRGKQRKRGKNMEYFDHIKTCGIESNYTNKTQEVETQKEMAKLENIEQLEPEIDMCMKEEIEIKKEDPNDVYDPNIVVKTEPHYEGMTNVNIAVKNETSFNNDIDLEANYGEQLKLHVKQEPVLSLETVHLYRTDNMEVLNTQVKTEEEESDDFETLSLELTIVSTEESFGNPLFDSVCLNDLGDLFMDRSTLDIVATTGDDENNIENSSTESQSDNLGDAWFKKISEMERKKTHGQNIHKNEGKRVKAKTDTVTKTKTVFKPHKRQMKKVLKIENQ